MKNSGVTKPPISLSPHSSRFTPYVALALAGALALSGCGTTPSRPSTSRDVERPTAPVAKAPATPRGGGFYLDDGPGDNPPADLDRVPDAVPRAEPLHRGAMRPYVVMGRNYTPMTTLQPYQARGIASWYGRRYHGKPTSSGEPYDMYGMTAAHPLLPIPSYVRVTNVTNGRSVVVRVNDRGPFLHDRLIDLSYTAAYKLGLLNGGSGQVEVEAILPEAYARYTSTARVATVTTAPAPVAPPAPAATAATTTDAGAASGVFLQLGAFGSRDNAQSFIDRLRGELDWLGERAHIHTRDGLHRVHAGPYANAADARAAAERVMQALGTRPLVITR